MSSTERFQINKLIHRSHIAHARLDKFPVLSPHLAFSLAQLNRGAIATSKLNSKVNIIYNYSEPEHYLCSEPVLITHT